MTARSNRKSRRLPIYQGASELRLETWVQLARTFYRIQRRVVSAVAAHDLTVPQFDVLATLEFSEGVTQQELAERLLVTKGNVCGVLDRLESLGWIERRADPRDARANRLHLTPAGGRKIQAVLPDHDAVVIGIMQRLETGGVRTLRALLLELDEAI